jgi:hypothetical protein
MALLLHLSSGKRRRKEKKPSLPTFPPTNAGKSPIWLHEIRRKRLPDEVYHNFPAME